MIKKIIWVKRFVLLTTSLWLVLCLSSYSWAGYNYYQPLTLKNNSGRGGDNLNKGYTLFFTVNTSSLVYQSKMLDTGNDLRVFFKGKAIIEGRELDSWSEIDRDVIIPTGFTLATSTLTQVYFTVQDIIAVGGTDSARYRLLYGNEEAVAPSINKLNIYSFYDDFNDGNDTGWYKRDPGPDQDIGTWSVVNNKYAPSITGTNYSTILLENTTAVYSYTFSVDYELVSGTGTFGLILLANPTSERYYLEIFGGNILRFRNQSEEFLWADRERTTPAMVVLSTAEVYGAHTLEIQKGDNISESSGEADLSKPRGIKVLIDGAEKFFAPGVSTVFDVLPSSSGRKGLYAENTEIYFDNVRFTPRISIGAPAKQPTVTLGSEKGNEVYVQKVTQDPPSPIGEGNLYFDFEFNQEMDRTIIPEVKIVLADGSTKYLTGQWASPTIFYCRTFIPPGLAVGNGIVRLKDAVSLTSDGLRCANYKNSNLLNLDYSKVVAYPGKVDIIPNPFSPNGDGIFEQTQIMFELDKQSNVSVKVFTLSGTLVRTLKDERLMDKGLNVVSWDGKDDGDNIVSQGLYLCQVKIGDRMTVYSVVVSK